VTTRTHYHVLGLESSASADSIREAYRRLAREYHPDRVAGSAAGSDKMSAINEAYRVLSDPGRRAVYDATLRGAGHASTTTTTAEPASTSGFRPDLPGDEAMQEWRYQHPDGPPRIPWRVLSICSLLAIMAIFVLAQFSTPGDPAAPDGILRNGDCVEILANNDAREVRCTGNGDLVVRQFIGFDRVCANAYAAHRDRQGMGVACIETMPTVAPTE
jgi:molecular chaperone DnaJ